MDYQDLLDQRENLEFKDYLVWWDRRETEDIKEMLDQREMKETEGWLEKMVPQVLLVFQEKWVRGAFQDQEVSTVFLVLLVFLDLREQQGPKEMRDQLVPLGGLD